MAFILYTENPGNYYPQNGDLYFGVPGGGTDTAHYPYAVPIARFEFYNNRGEPETSAPIIYMRFTTGFDTNLSQGWQSVQAFGAMYAGLNDADNPAKAFLESNNFGLGSNLLEAAGKSAYESLTRQILNALVGVAGFAAGAGATGKTQAEFLMRRMVNNFQQLAYAGPVFRRFQPSFTMRPTSEEEARTMSDIIASFRVASSPKTNRSTDDLKALDETEQERIAAEAERTADEKETPEQAQQREIAGQIDAAQAELVTFGQDERDQGTPLTFVYPDMVKYSIYLAVGGSATLLFDSELCMIENVAINYGAQSKLAFFDQANDGKYYPTEVTLTLSLQESVLVTAEKAANDHQLGMVMY